MNFNKKDSTIAEILETKYKLSKVCQNSLNFVTKDAEMQLLLKIQPAEILDLIKFVYIILDEDYNGINGNELISHLHTNIYPKLKVDCLSKSMHYINIYKKHFLMLR